ncbi:hypothetical protein [Streptomyces sp. H27-D2]|uniref:hypothetical protein n=1 Tax=Streptomyces sp. H27-D2 TaxID=3046304 RepID=UPI002DB5A3CA|nr:hypothetical protein [Streptomyces sp. H27-D2]MEC4016489.1 hypothetical protein [Streptomyces sp. H27-D2]
MTAPVPGNDENAQWESPPKDYNLVVPYGWFQLKLDPDDRDRSIVALAEYQFRGLDNAPHLKEQFMRELQKRAKEAYKVGGMELYLSTLSVGSLPLASSLLVTMPPPDAWPGSATVHELADSLRGSGRDVRVVELPVAGRAVRERRKEAPSPDTQMGNTLPTTTVTFHVPIPASSAWLMMAFSTPIEPLADRMEELFDTVAETLQWA